MQPTETIVKLEIRLGNGDNSCTSDLSLYCIEHLKSRCANRDIVIPSRLSSTMGHLDGRKLVFIVDARILFESSSARCNFRANLLPVGAIL